MERTKRIITLLALAAVLLACPAMAGKQTTFDPEYGPALDLASITLTEDGAFAVVEILHFTGAITASGVCWSSTDPQPLYPSASCASGGGTEQGVYTIDIGPLSPATTYYARAYAVDSQDTGYSYNNLEFTTPTDGEGPAEGDFTMASPLPQSDDLHSVWGNTANDVFAVGDLGAILHWDGLSWSEMSSNTLTNLHDVWGSAANDVFAVGLETIMHYDGQQWSEMIGLSGKLYSGVWGSGSGNVFVVSTGGDIYHYNGVIWTPQEGGALTSLNGVWGAGANDVFAVGDEGVILRYDGKSWSTMTSNTAKDLHSVWGTASNDVFAVGADGTVLHFNGGEWSTMTTTFSGVLYGVWGASAADVYAVGADGTILRYDWDVWAEMDSPTTSGLSGIWGASANAVYAVGADGAIIRHGAESSWPALTFTYKTVNGMWTDTIGNFRAAGSEAIYAYNGEYWTTVHDDYVSEWSGTYFPGVFFKDIWGYSTRDLYAVGIDGAIYHFDGNFWTAQESGAGATLNAIWGESASKVFVAGDEGTILRLAGGAWETMEGMFFEYDFLDIWGGSASDIYAVSESRIYHYDGSVWTDVITGVNEIDFSNFWAVWGDGSGDVFFAGANGAIAHYNGSSWEIMNSGVTNHLKAIWGAAANDVFAVGDAGTILHYDGTAWTQLESMTSTNLDTVYGLDGGNVFIAGGNEMHHHTVAYGASGLPRVINYSLTPSSASAVADNEVMSEGGSSVTARGMCWTNLTTYQETCSNDGVGTGSYTTTLAPLTPKTTYLAYAYATNSQGTAKSGEVNFTTLGSGQKAAKVPLSILLFEQ